MSRSAISGLVLALAVLPAQAQMPLFPPATDLQRFPPEAIAAQMEVFSARYQDILRSRIVWGGPWVAEHWRELGEVQDIGLAWHNLRMAWQSSQEQGWYLNELREAIGNNAYMAGQMPSPIPLGRLRRVE